MASIFIAMLFPASSCCHDPTNTPHGYRSHPVVHFNIIINSRWSIVIILAEGAIALSVTLSGGALFNNSLLVASDGDADRDDDGGGNGGGGDDGGYDGCDGDGDGDGAIGGCGGGDAEWWWWR